MIDMNILGFRTIFRSDAKRDERRELGGAGASAKGRVLVVVERVGGEE
jgi:hypothetical protein